MDDLLLSILLLVAGIGLVIGIARVPPARAIPMTASSRTVPPPARDALADGAGPRVSVPAGR